MVGDVRDEALNALNGNGYLLRIASNAGWATGRNAAGGFGAHATSLSLHPITVMAARQSLGPNGIDPTRTRNTK